MTDETTGNDEAAMAAEKKAKEAEAEEAKKAKEAANAKKTPQDYILDRKDKQIEKLRKQLEEAEQEKEAFAPTKELSTEELFNQRMEREEQVSEIIKKYPALEEDREKIRKYIHDPSRKGIPIEEVVAGAIGINKFIEIGAKMQAEADEDAKLGRMGGRNPADVKSKTQEDVNRERFKQMPRFIQQAQKTYNEHFNS